MANFNEISSLLDAVKVNESEINDTVTDIIEVVKDLEESVRLNRLLLSVRCIDLTTLAGDDTAERVAKLVHKALHPLEQSVLDGLPTRERIRCASVCVYPARVSDAIAALRTYDIPFPVASVAAGFPSGQTFLPVKLSEIRSAVSLGASEIDIVISRNLVLEGKWEELYNEVKELRKACGEAKMKSILETGELQGLSNVYKASIVAMAAGSDFIKTSTGKAAVNATLPVGVVMARAISEHYGRTGVRVGLKPAGGLKVGRDAFHWLEMVHAELGDDWLKPELFRLGASSLLGALEREIKEVLQQREIQTDEPCVGDY